MKLLVPAYAWPGPIWDQVTSAANVGVFVMNPANGPAGAMSDPHSIGRSRLMEKFIPVAGYQATDYAAKTDADLLWETDRYSEFYAPDYIFYDEASTNAANLAYYRTLVYRALARGMTPILNFGAVPDVQYTTSLLSKAIFVTFEADMAAYRTQTFPNWHATAPTENICHIVHDVESTEVEEALDLAAARNVGLIYLTDDSGANPYDTIPSYFDTLDAAVGAQ